MCVYIYVIMKVLHIERLWSLTCTMPFKINLNSDLLHFLFLRTRSLFVWSWTRKKSTTCWRRWLTSRRALTASSTTRRTQNYSVWFVSTQLLPQRSRDGSCTCRQTPGRMSGRQLTLHSDGITCDSEGSDQRVKEQNVAQNESLCRLNRKSCVSSVWTANISSFEK